MPWEKVKNIGWTKLKDLAPVLTKENVDQWVPIAEQQTAIQLVETVKAAVAANSPKALEDQTSKTVTTKTFKVHEDQKTTIEAAIDKAKAAANTTVDTVALELICMDYAAAPTMVQRLKQMGIEAALKALEDAYPNAKIDVELTEEAA